MKSIWSYLFKTGHETAPLLIRIMLAVIMFPHGTQKMFGWFGGYGFEGTIGAFTGKGSGIPYVFALMAILTEFLSPFFLLTGFLVRVWGIGLVILMLVAILKVHLSQGWFGFELNLLILTPALILAIVGAGKASVDKMIYEKKYLTK